MTYDRPTIVDFLLARIAEDEEVAERLRRPALGDPWGWQPRPHPLTVNDARRVEATPARVLAECAAKRAIVEDATRVLDAGLGKFSDQAIRAVLGPQVTHTLKLLAAIYGDHVHYRDEDWAL